MPQKRKKVHSDFNLVKLCDQIRASDSAVNFLKNCGILNKSASCRKCSAEVSLMQRKAGTGYWYFSCMNCKTKMSVRNNTILSHANIGLRTFIMLCYTFIMCQGLSLCQKIHEVWPILHPIMFVIFYMFGTFLSCRLISVIWTMTNLKCHPKVSRVSPIRQWWSIRKYFVTWLDPSWWTGAQRTTWWEDQGPPSR